MVSDRLRESWWLFFGTTDSVMRNLGFSNEGCFARSLFLVTIPAFSKLSNVLSVAARPNRNFAASREDHSVLLRVCLATIAANVLKTIVSRSCNKSDKVIPTCWPGYKELTVCEAISDPVDC